MTPQQRTPHQRDRRFARVRRLTQTIFLGSGVVVGALRRLRREYRQASGHGDRSPHDHHDGARRDDHDHDDERNHAHQRAHHHHDDVLQHAVRTRHVQLGRS